MFKTHTEPTASSGAASQLHQTELQELSSAQQRITACIESLKKESFQGKSWSVSPALLHPQKQKRWVFFRYFFTSSVALALLFGSKNALGLTLGVTLVVSVLFALLVRMAEKHGIWHAQEIQRLLFPLKPKARTFWDRPLGLRHQLREYALLSLFDPVFERKLGQLHSLLKQQEAYEREGKMADYRCIQSYLDDVITHLKNKQNALAGAPEINDQIDSLLDARLNQLKATNPALFKQWIAQQCQEQQTDPVSLLLNPSTEAKWSMATQLEALYRHQIHQEEQQRQSRREQEQEAQKAQKVRELLGDTFEPPAEHGSALFEVCTQNREAVQKYRQRSQERSQV